MGYTFLQKPSSFKFLSILEEKCGADISNGTIKRKFLLTNVSKNGRWVSYTFPQKLSSCKFKSILKKIVVPTSLTEHLNVRLLLTNVAKKGLLSGLYFPTKTNFFQVSQHFRRKLWCRHQ